MFTKIDGTPSITTIERHKMNIHYELHKLELLAIRHSDAIKEVRALIAEQCPQHQIDVENAISCMLGSMRSEQRENTADLYQPKDDKEN
jgi:hypothetical protein